MTKIDYIFILNIFDFNTFQFIFKTEVGFVCVKIYNNINLKKYLFLHLLILLLFL